MQFSSVRSPLGSVHSSRGVSEATNLVLKRYDFPPPVPLPHKVGFSKHNGSPFHPTQILTVATNEYKPFKILTGNLVPTEIPPQQFQD